MSYIDVEGDDLVKVLLEPKFDHVFGNGLDLQANHFIVCDRAAAAVATSAVW